MDEQSFVTRLELESATNRVEDRMAERIERVELKISDHDKCIASVEATLVQFKDLPTILNTLNGTLIRFDGRMCNMEKGIENLEKKTSSQSATIREISEKGKVDWMESVKKNWWGIVLFIAAVVMLLKSQGVF